MSTRLLDAPGPAAAVARARTEVAGLDERLWAAVADGDLLEVASQVAGLRAQLAALEAHVLVELDDRQVPRRLLHWACTGDWLAATAGTTRAHARRTLAHAHDLLTTRTTTLHALASGDLSPVQAGVVCEAVTDLPGDPDLRQRAETVLVEQATHLDATDLTRAARHVLAVVDPDREDRRAEAQLAAEERAAHTSRFLSIRDDGYGGIRIKGRGTLEDGAVLRAALLPLTAPQPTHDTHAADPEDTGAGELRDVRDHGARTWDALVQIAQHALDTDLPPTSHGARPRVSITIPLNDLHAGLGIGLHDGSGVKGRSAATEDGLDLHPAAVRRLACDADIIPITLGTHGVVLDVGRAYRTAPEAIWRALVTRDRHCTFPGCRRPPIMCHAHHLIHWADGGTTALANLALLCGEHHRTIHHTPWRIRLNPHDHRPEFLPPPRHRTSSHDTDHADHGATGPPTWIRQRE